MQNIADDKEKFDAAEKNLNDKVVLRIFDFDNTLYKSPVPNPKLWDNRTLGKIEAETKTHGWGWWQDPITLSDRYINPDDFNSSIVSEVRKSIEDPNSFTVLLTGRTTAYAPQIKKLISKQGLEFDFYGLKPVGYPGTTLEYKLEFIKNTLQEIAKSGRKVTSIEMWDDRQKHVQKFKAFLSSMKDLESFEVHEVTGAETSMPEDLEKELVGILKNKAEEKHRNTWMEAGESIKSLPNKKPLYYAVVLDDESRNKLLASIPVPEGWQKIAHHMTIIFNPQGKSELLDKTIQNLGKEVSLKVVEFGSSEDAIAVKVECEIPSSNLIPHITIAIPPRGKAVNSNKITSWNKIDAIKDLNLKGIVTALYK